MGCVLSRGRFGSAGFRLGGEKGTWCGACPNSATAPATVGGERRLKVPLREMSALGKASLSVDPQVRRPARAITQFVLGVRAGSGDPQR